MEQAGGPSIAIIDFPSALWPVIILLMLFGLQPPLKFF